MPSDPANPRHRWIHHFGQLIRRLEDGLLVLLLALMILIAGGQIVLRNFFDSGLVWADPLLRILVLWLALLGAIVASRSDNHISIDMLSRYLGPLLQALSRLITGFFTALVCGLVSYYGVSFVHMDFEAGTRAFAQVPAWLLELIIPLGFALIALRYLLTSLHNLAALCRKRP